jgi:hypothetical protein
MYTKSVLEQLLQKPIGKARVLQIARLAGTEFHTSDLLELSLDAKCAEIAFRAAWILENIQMLQPEKFWDYELRFFEAYPQQGNQSCRRHYTKIMMTCLQSGLEKVRGDLDRVVEATFDWLVDTGTPVAVKVNCLDILCRLKIRYNWVSEELRAQTEFLLRNGTPAMQARGRKILRQLKMP